MSSGDGNDTLGGNGGNDTLSAGNGNDYVYGGDGNDTVDAGEGADYAYGGNGNDVLLGGGGGDVLYGDAGNDILDGGTGIDYLRGGAGSDVYRYAAGSGNDQIDEQSSTDSGTDRIDLAGLNPGDVTVSRNAGDDLVLRIAASGETLTVVDGFLESNSSKWVESVAFADGSSWSLADLRTRALTGTSGVDTMYGHAGDDVIDGNGGNDVLYGRNGNDSLQGGVGNDSLYGEAGHDLLDGGSGNDLLSGGTGNNRYFFGRGGGQDTVANQLDNTAGKSNVLQLGADITPMDVHLSRVHSSYWGWAADLQVGIVGASDRITFGGGWRGVIGYNDYATVQSIAFADGSVWGAAEIQAAVYAAEASGSPAPSIQMMAGEMSFASAGSSADAGIPYHTRFGPLQDQPPALRRRQPIVERPDRVPLSAGRRGFITGETLTDAARLMADAMATFDSAAANSIFVGYGQERTPLRDFAVSAASTFMA
jgi:Ca2+-binding RTX toxin-like protein